MHKRSLTLLMLVWLATPAADVVADDYVSNRDIF